MMGGDKPKNFKGTIGKLIRHLAGYRLATAIVIILAIASARISYLWSQTDGLHCG